jgi:hypothetical protein
MLDTETIQYARFEELLQRGVNTIGAVPATIPLTCPECGGPLAATQDEDGNLLDLFLCEKSVTVFEQRPGSRPGTFIAVATQVVPHKDGKPALFFMEELLTA